jgi:hypothetical protein
MAEILLPIVRESFPLPATARAIYDSALYVQAAWVEAARSGRFIGVGTGRYASGILTPDSLAYPLDGDPYSAMVINVAPHASIIEDGHPGYHLPDVIRWAQARTARRSKQGVWYMAVPFRHNIPRTGAGITSQAARTMMPQAVYNRARHLRPGQRLSNEGLPAYQPRHAPNVRPGEARTSIYAGMRKQGATGHTQYMTFRTITSQSPGWHIPALPPQPIAATVARETTPAVIQRVSAAFAADVAHQLQARLEGA